RVAPGQARSRLAGTLGAPTAHRGLFRRGRGQIDNIVLQFQFPHALLVGGQSPLRAFAEPVVEGGAGAAHWADRVGSPPAIQTLAQSPDVYVDGALVDIDVAAPDAVEQLLAREHAAGALHQKFEQTELGGSEWDFAAAARDPLLFAIELDVAGGQNFGDPFGPDPA